MKREHWLLRPWWLPPLIVFLIGGTILFFTGRVLFKAPEEISKEINSAKEFYVGKKVVIEQDTFQIIDYSVLFETCTLSNGVKISKVLVDKQLFPTKVSE